MSRYIEEQESFYWTINEFQELFKQYDPYIIIGSMDSEIKEVLHTALRGKEKQHE